MTDRDTKIRRGTIDDVEALVDFNVAMAQETESRTLAREVVDAGIRGLVEQPARGFYLVAERASQVVGALMVTREWSDWRNGDFWWIQSVYVHPDHRRSGVYRRLYETVRRAAVSKAGVCGIRLYVERDNARARSTYEALGMHETPYRLFESDID